MTRLGGEEGREKESMYYACSTHCKNFMVTLVTSVAHLLFQQHLVLKWYTECSKYVVHRMFKICRISFKKREGQSRFHVNYR